MPSYDQTIEELYSLLRLGIRPGLKCIRMLLAELGDPQREYPAVHVAGTNGKGSTSAMVEAVLTEAGFRTGLFTSPHLVRYNERIRVAKREIPDRDVVRVYSTVKEASRRIRLRPTFFEFTTAMALVYFRERRVDMAVLETGMGGRLDATNAARPLVSVITNIGKDHTAHLGTTLARIAYEKAGIIKRAVPIVTAEDKPSAKRVISGRARKRRAPLYTFGADFLTEPSATPGSNSFDYFGILREIKGLKTNLRGGFQARNAACAVAAAELLSARGFDVPVGAVRRGLLKVQWPGRLEVVGRRGARHGARAWPLVILDAAHNKEAVSSLVEALASFRFSRLVLVLGILGDKDVRGVCSLLGPVADAFVLTEPRNPRAASPETLSGLLGPWARPTVIRRSVAEACGTALEMAGPKDAVCVTGSVFTVGEATEFFRRAAPPL